MVQRIVKKSEEENPDSEHNLSEDQLVLLPNFLTDKAKTCAGRMKRADEGYNREIGEDRGARRDVYGVTDVSYETLRDFKRLGKDTFGPELLEDIQLTGSTPHDPRAILQQLDLLVDWLSNPEKEFPEPLASYMNPPQKEAVLAHVSPVQEKLQVSVAFLEQELKETETFMLEKTQAIAEFDSIIREPDRF